MKKFKTIFLISLLVLLAACANEKGDKQESKTPDPLEVSLIVQDTAKVNEKVTLKAEVSQSGNKVEDADEVEFEIRKPGSSESEMLASNNLGEGIYTASAAFDKKGKYTVISHVTARNLHSMPSRNITVAGNGGAKHSDHVHQHDSNTLLHFSPPPEPKTGEDLKLSVHIENNNVALDDADVRFEIWQNSSDKHDFVEAKAAGEGVYQAIHVFKAAGDYNIKIHFEKEGIHEHQLEKLAIQ
ncbi:FixH family protein [Peribacillus sp. SCS-37]|uniref:FixH family protein n=1 Tax=Paraperibacillus esterisolvens TaxID=3115296 RepID=UPI0039065655